MEPSRADFCHPFQPYEIQLQFMRNLYSCIEEGKVAIFESPTGTGKSLSLICGALSWLRDHARRELEIRYGNGKADDTTDWLATAEKIALRREFIREREKFELTLAQVKRQEATRIAEQRDAKRIKQLRPERKDNEEYKTTNEDEFVLEEYTEERDASSNHTSDVSLSISTQALLDKLKRVPRTAEEEEPAPDTLKIIFCSRTHSQLTQFIGELKRVHPPSGMHSFEAEISRERIPEVVKHLPLASRKNLCINPSVLKLGSTMAINERCLDLQKPGSSKERRCAYIPSREDQNRLSHFRDRAIATVGDIEDVANLGRQMKLCPYYASRSAIPDAEILTLPYPLLLSRTARNALGVNLRDNVIIIDEAHNLMDAIADTSSVSMSLAHLDLATRQVTGYIQKFKNRLKGLNRMYVTQVVRLLNSISDTLRTAFAKSKENEIAVTTGQLMSGKGVDQVRPHKLLAFLHQSKLCYKVEGYAQSHQDATENSQPRGVLLQFQTFLTVLMNPGPEGRFYISQQKGEILVNYMLLNPTEHFRDVVDASRSVILAGGTMSPMSDYTEYLFSYLAADRLETYSFGHVIPKENMLAQVLTLGPGGVEFDFTFSKRNSEEMICELGKAVRSLCHMVPDGLVAFFPSYDYLNRVMTVWRQNPSSHSIMEDLEAQKSVYIESRGVQSDQLLQDYAQAVDQGRGALMLSVVGGKLSEGINFSDKLGRAVIAIGLPFPNAQNPEWKAKMEHIEQVKVERCMKQGMSERESKAAGLAASRDYYENSCMRAINQSIGRAIRHRNDYAAIFLIDRRFATDRIHQKLPGWIRTTIIREQGSVAPWASMAANLRQFFKDKQ